MSLLAIAWRNLWRHPRRSLITAGAMSMGVGFCMAIMAYTSGMFSQMNRIMVDEQTGHVQVHHPEYPKSRKLHDTIPEELLQRSNSAEGVRVASARLYGAALVASEAQTTGAQIVGVVPPEEARLTVVSRNMRAGRYLGPEPKHEVIVGVELAEKLRLEPGDELVIVTQAADGSMGNDLFQVTGTFRSGQTALDKGGVFVHLDDLAELLVLPDQIHEVVVLGEDQSQSETLKASVAASVGDTDGDALLVQTWQETSPATAQMLAMSGMSKYIIMAFVFGLAAFGVVNTMLMSVFERTRELGVAIAVGMRPRQVVGMIVLESLLLGAISALVGGLFGAGLDWYLVTRGLPLSTESGGTLSAGGILFEKVVYGVVVPADIAVVLVAVMLVSALASLWPAIRAARLRPVDAMRQE